VNTALAGTPVAVQIARTASDWLDALDEHGSSAGGKPSFCGEKSSPMLGARTARLKLERKRSVSLIVHEPATLYAFTPPTVDQSA